MKKIVDNKPIIRYEANDGRIFSNEERCKEYEYLTEKWLNKRRETTDTCDARIFCYYVHNYDELLEISSLESMVNNNYVNVHPQESYYNFPQWVYCPDSPHGLDYYDIISPIEHLENEIEEVEEVLNKIKLDISNMREIAKYENNIS